MELIPAIDLLGGRVVRLAEGDYGRVTGYGDDPVAVARAWVGEGATRLHLVDLDGARAGRPVQAATIARIATAVGVRCQVAGGLRHEDAVREALGAGADRVVLGSALVRDPSLAATLVARHGPDALVAAIDVRDGRALGDGWVPGAAAAPAETLVAMLAARGVRWFAVTAIARDGLLSGPDLPLIERAARAAPEARIIASGGIASLADIAAVRDLGCAAAILGRTLYEGLVRLPDALAVAAGGGTGSAA